ncbi:TPA: hypothetical protein EYO63_12835 [Candidatus Poribacteria bacterium]|nr:hypothetical protein [Candidatus Poribacteria bacterium]HIO77818.1 hypothetical protein [Candidatus Poribacteria bacterium]
MTKGSVRWNLAFSELTRISKNWTTRELIDDTFGSGSSCHGAKSLIKTIWLICGVDMGRPDFAFSPWFPVSASV